MVNNGTQTPAAPVAVIPDQVQFDCRACGVTHVLMRQLDYAERPDGSWRCEEPGGFECDCGLRIPVHFRLTLEPR